MNTIENAFAIEDAEKEAVLMEDLKHELNARLIDMGEISALDNREVKVLESIRGKLGKTPSYDNLGEEIPEDLLKEYVQTMFQVEQDKLAKSLDQVGSSDVERPFMDKYEQAKALGLEVVVDDNVKHVLELP